MIWPPEHTHFQHIAMSWLLWTSLVYIKYGSSGATALTVSTNRSTICSKWASFQSATKISRLSLHSESSMTFGCPTLNGKPWHTSITQSSDSSPCQCVPTLSLTTCQSKSQLQTSHGYYQMMLSRRAAQSQPPLVSFETFQVVQPLAILYSWPQNHTTPIGHRGYGTSRLAQKQIFQFSVRHVLSPTLTSLRIGRMILSSE